MAAVMKVQCAESVAVGWTAAATATGTAAAAASPPPPARFTDTLFTDLRCVGRLTLIVFFWVTGLSSSPSAIAISAVLLRLPPPVSFAGACFLRTVGASLGRLRRIVFGALGFSSPLDPSAASREIRDVCRFASGLPDAVTAGAGTARFAAAAGAGLILIVLGPLAAGAVAGAIALSRGIFDVSRLAPPGAAVFVLSRLTPTAAGFSFMLFGFMAAGLTATGAVFGSAGTAAFGLACRRTGFAGAGTGFTEGVGVGAKGVGVGIVLAAGGVGVAGISIRKVSEVRSLPGFALAGVEGCFGAGADVGTRFRKSSLGGSALSSIGASAMIKLLCSECPTIAACVGERQPQHFSAEGTKLPLSLLL
jgi:hypothetical protein